MVVGETIRVNSHGCYVIVFIRTIGSMLNKTSRFVENLKCGIHVGLDSFTNADDYYFIVLIYIYSTTKVYMLRYSGIPPDNLNYIWLSFSREM